MWIMSLTYYGFIDASVVIQFTTATCTAVSFDMIDTSLPKLNKTEEGHPMLTFSQPNNHRMCYTYNASQFSAS